MRVVQAGDRFGLQIVFTDSDFSRRPQPYRAVRAGNAPTYLGPTRITDVPADDE